jgi:hypothetical protein
MRLLRRVLILFPDLNALVRFSRDETQPGPVEARAHDAGLGVQRTGLGDRLGVLEAVACFPVPERDGAVVATREHDVVFIDGKCVDDAVGRLEVQHKVTPRTHPLLYRLR